MPGVFDTLPKVPMQGAAKAYAPTLKPANEASTPSALEPATPMPTPPAKEARCPGKPPLTGGTGQNVATDLGNSIKQEGLLGFLTDPVGALDRQKAQHDLASKFQIVDPKFQGQRLPNQVTQEEFEKIAKTYSDIRLERSDIKFGTDGMSDEDAAKYKSGAVQDMGSLMQTPAGRELLFKLANNTSGEKDKDGNPVHHTTTLKPFLKDGKVDPTNSQEDVAPGANRANSSNGQGTNTVVNYNPGQAVTPAGGSKQPWWPARSDVIMMHEMTHAYHDTIGDTDYGMVQASDGVPTDVGHVAEYEHQAVGLGKYKNNSVSENAYRKQRAEIATGCEGVLPGDSNMPQRDYYD